MFEVDTNVTNIYPPNITTGKVDDGVLRQLSNAGVPEKTGLSMGSNIHTFVNFDEFSMNVSPNLIRDRQSISICYCKFK